VLPYVFEGAVESHRWLTAVQMIDGLALGETTPGPLIMVVSFVGFVGAWTGGGARSRIGIRIRGGRRAGRHVLHLPAVVLLHLRRRTLHRVDARRPCASPRR
jgi:chromate transport protein ChrA